MSYIKTSALLFIILLMNKGLYAQQNPDTPKIGVVLSGGGARGMAHIGVLKALEQAGIYPDVITGTSMGSVVGGLYALGYSANEIEKIATEANWELLLSNQVPFREVAIEEKPYYGRYILEFPVKGLSPRLPSGVIEGENLYKLFSELTRSAHGITDFDDLPVPFRCVATDIGTGERVVIGSGSLAESIRASMAIPSIFTPVDIGDRLLVDGGLVRNFPVQEAIDMGADIIIGVFVSDDLAPKEELGSLADILIQSSWVMSAYDTREQTKLVNVYLEPDLKGYSTGSFTESEEIIARGIEIGNAFLPTFDALADSLENIGKVFIKPKKLDELDSYQINKVIVRGNEKIPTDFILGKLRIGPSDELMVGDINKRLREVYGTQYFSKIDYELIRASSDYDLLIKVKEKPQVYLKTALYYNNETRAGLNVNLTARNKVWPNSRLLAEIDLSENFRTDLSFLKYIGRRQDAAGILGYRSLQSNIPIFENGEQQATFKDFDHRFYMSLQTTKKSTTSTGLKLEANVKRYRPIISESLGDLLEKVKEESVTASAFWNVNTLNDPMIPTKGINFNISLGYNFQGDIDFELDEGNPVVGAVLDSLFLMEDHGVLTIDLKYLLPLSERLSVFTESRLNYHSTNQTALGSVTGLGGFFVNHPNTIPFWGASFYEFQSLSFAMTRVGIQVQPTKNLFIIGGVNYLDSRYPMEWFDGDYMAELFGDQESVWGAGLQLVYRSAFGPLALAVGKSDASERWHTGINIGFWY